MGASIYGDRESLNEFKRLSAKDFMPNKSNFLQKPAVNTTYKETSSIKSMTDWL